MSSSQHTRAIHVAASLKARCVTANAASWPVPASLQQMARVGVLFIQTRSATSRQKRKGGAAVPPRLQPRVSLPHFYEPLSSLAPLFSLYLSGSPRSLSRRSRCTVPMLDILAFPRRPSTLLGEPLPTACPLFSTRLLLRGTVHRVSLW